MQETRVQSLDWGDPLEKKIATCSSVLAWKIPWTEEPGGLQPMGSQRVRHNQATEHRHAGKQQANIPSGHCQGHSDHRIHSRGRDYSESPTIQKTQITGCSHDWNGNQLGRIGAVPKGCLISLVPGVMTPFSRELRESQSWKGPP